MERERPTEFQRHLSQRWAVLSAVTVGLISLVPSARANGINRNGVGAESMSMGGTETAWAASPLGAMAANSGRSRISRYA